MELDWQAKRRKMEEIRSVIEEAQRAQAEALKKMAPEYLEQVKKVMEVSANLPPETQKFLANYAKISELAAKTSNASSAKVPVGTPRPIIDFKGSDSVKDIDRSVEAESGQSGDKASDNFDALKQWTEDAEVMALLEKIHSVMEGQLSSSDEQHCEVMRNEKTVRRQGFAILALTVAGLGFGTWDSFNNGDVSASVDELSVQVSLLNGKLGQFAEGQGSELGRSTVGQKKSTSVSDTEGEQQPVALPGSSSEVKSPTANNKNESSINGS